MNSDRYKEIIDEIIKPQLDASTVPLKLMHDAHRAHTSRATMAYLQSLDIEPISCPIPIARFESN
jgi:hypothetical protein